MTIPSLFRRTPATRLEEERGATDPILVIAAIAVSLVLLVGGSYAVAGIITSGNDLNAQGDLEKVSTTQESLFASTDGLYVYDNHRESEHRLLQRPPVDSGVIGFTPTAGGRLIVDVAGPEWIATSVSKSGTVYMRSSEQRSAIEVGTTTLPMASTGLAMTVADVPGAAYPEGFDADDVTAMVDAINGDYPYFGVEDFDRPGFGMPTAPVSGGDGNGDGGDSGQPGDGSDDGSGDDGSGDDGAGGDEGSGGDGGTGFTVPTPDYSMTAAGGLSNWTTRHVFGYAPAPNAIDRANFDIGSAHAWQPPAGFNGDEYSYGYEVTTAYLLDARSGEWTRHAVSDAPRQLQPWENANECIDFDVNKCSVLKWTMFTDPWGEPGPVWNMNWDLHLDGLSHRSPHGADLESGHPHPRRRPQRPAEPHAQLLAGDRQRTPLSDGALPVLRAPAASIRCGDAPPPNR